MEPGAMRVARARSCMAADTTRKPGWGRSGAHARARRTPLTRRPRSGAPSGRRRATCRRACPAARACRRRGSRSARAARCWPSFSGKMLAWSVQMPAPLGRFDQCPQEASADALAARALGDVDHLLRDAAVDVAARVGARAPPSRRRRHPRGRRGGDRRGARHPRPRRPAPLVSSVAWPVAMPSA